MQVQRGGEEGNYSVIAPVWGIGKTTFLEMGRKTEESTRKQKYL